MEAGKGMECPLLVEIDDCLNRSAYVYEHTRRQLNNHVFIAGFVFRRISTYVMCLTVTGYRVCCQQEALR